MQILPEASAHHFEQKVTRIYDHLYASSGVKTPQGIAYEVGKIIHAAIYKEKNQHSGAAFSHSIADHKKIQAGNTEFIHAAAGDIQRLFAIMNEKAQLYPAQETIKIGDFDLVFVCYELAGIRFSDPRRDVLGEALELFRSHWVKSHGGQFFTDPHVTELAMELLQFDPLNGDDLIDICAGTGGFLLAGLNHISKLINGEQRPAQLREIALKALKGQEVDEDVCEIANVTLASRIGSKVSDIVKTANSLSFENTSLPAQPGKHFCVATNPPFGTKITIKDPSILRGFELAQTSSRAPQDELFPGGRLAHRAPDVLFLEQNLRLLVPAKGRLAIVLPYQILSGPQTYYVREWLLKHAFVKAVVDLPAETFQPYTGTKASLVVLCRRPAPLQKIDLVSDPDVFMAVPRWIGHDRRGNPKYRMMPDGSEADVVLTDFPEVAEAFLRFQTGESPSTAHKDCFRLSPRKFLDGGGLRMDARFYRPAAHAAAPSNHAEGEDDFVTKKLRDVVKEIFYPGRFKRNYVDRDGSTVPFLGGTNISQLLLTVDKWFRPDDPRLKEMRVRAGWVLVTRSGSTGIVSSVPQAWDGFAVSEHVIRIVPDEDKLPGAYVYAFLKTGYAQEILKRGVYGSVIDTITPEYIGDTDILIPRSKITLAKIVQSVERGENARQEAIHLLSQGVQALEELVSCRVPGE